MLTGACPVLVRIYPAESCFDLVYSKAVLK
jgi:hypothetical protein